MVDAIVQWFTANLSGFMAKEVIVFIISMIPILELRGGLLAASPALLNVPILTAIPLCIIGNHSPCSVYPAAHQQDFRMDGARQPVSSRCFMAEK